MHKLKFLPGLFAFVMSLSCNQKTNLEKDLKRCLEKAVDMSMFEEVYKGNTIISYDDFRRSNKFISLVYLEDGCNSCYQKYIDWNQKIDSLKLSKDYTVLFIIQGFRYSNFISRVKEIKDIDEVYYSTIDSGYVFLNKNQGIPKWIFDSSILLDPENRIKLVGVPWKNKDMVDLFYKITQVYISYLP